MHPSNSYLVPLFSGSLVLILYPTPRAIAELG